jgi:homospermidine synthase
MLQPITPVDFPGRLLVIGYGSVGRGVLPLVRRHIGVGHNRISIVSADPLGRREAELQGIAFDRIELTRDNLADEIARRLGPNDFLLNLSVDVSSLALIELCQQLGALYLDTCIEPWPGGYTDPSLSIAARSNHALREQALAAKRRYRDGPTAVVAHGANPGLVSHFVKRALLHIAEAVGAPVAAPADREGWAALAQALGVKMIHIAERDTQIGERRKRRGEFVNTWSVDGFIAEGCQPAELGWGTHERHFPPDGCRHDAGSGAGIYLARPGASQRVRSWTPSEGPYHGFLITHNEAISIADYLTLRKAGEVAYRPTVLYAYHPCDAAVLSLHEFNGKNLRDPQAKRLMVDEVFEGMDELGVLVAGHARGAYWYGSQLSIEEARDLVPYNNATSLQVSAACIAGMIWAIENPRRGIVEAEELDHERILGLAEPYLRPLVGAFTDWTPLQDREALFPEDLDRDDPWQFKNVRVV